jgi:hypothetical protein
MLTTINELSLGRREHYFDCYFYDEPIEKIRLTVTLREGASGVSHPLEFAREARRLAERCEEAYRQTPEAFGPYEG